MRRHAASLLGTVVLYWLVLVLLHLGDVVARAFDPVDVRFREVD